MMEEIKKYIESRIKSLEEKRETLLREYTYLQKENDKNVVAAILVEKEFAIKELKSVLNYFKE